MVGQRGRPTCCHKRISRWRDNANIIRTFAAAQGEIDIPLLGGTIDLDWRLCWIRLCAARYRAIPQVQYCDLSVQVLGMPPEQRPTGNARDNQNARRDRKESALPAELVDLSELRKVAITWAARAKVIEPLLRLRERHRSRRDSLKNVRAGTPGALRIREFPEQTTAQRIQDALFILLRVSLRVQIRLPW